MYRRKPWVVENWSRIGKGVPDGWIDVNCWCERNVVRIPKAEFDQGLTWHCGHPKCKRP